MTQAAGTDRRIVELMEVEPPARDLHWLKAALQSAVELEFATLPVYLIGMWSIIDQEGEVFDLVDSVVREEMLHLGLASGGGGKPRWEERQRRSHPACNEGKEHELDDGPPTHRARAYFKRNLGRTRNRPISVLAGKEVEWDLESESS